MTPRSIRRALERKARKQEARKARIEMTDTPEMPAAAVHVSEARAEANRRNAQFSTGPRTEAGKAVSSINNRKHSFRGAFFLAPAENTDEWEELKEELMLEWMPLSETENNLVQMLAENFWLRK